MCFQQRSLVYLPQDVSPSWACHNAGGTNYGLVDSIAQASSKEAEVRLRLLILLGWLEPMEGEK
jgi:hypothetical protein